MKTVILNLILAALFVLFVKIGIEYPETLIIDLMILFGGIIFVIKKSKI